jgi:PAS domain S-box-containing protein
MYISLGLGLFFVVVVIFLAVRLSNSIIKPIKQLSQITKEYGKGDLSFRASVNTGDEIGFLANDFNNMADNISKFEKSIKEEQGSLKIKQQELEKQKLAALNILEDIAEEKGRTLMEKEKLSRILQSIGDAVFVVDERRRVIIFNRAAEEITGYLAGEAIGRPAGEVLKMIYEHDRSPNNIVERALTTGKIQEITSQTLLINKYGRDVPIADSAAPIRDREGKIFGCIVVFRDVTHEREIDRQKSEFVSVASHQLRTPLTSIKWFLEMLLDGDAGKLNNEQREMVQQVFDSGERMIDLVNKLLNISRIESGRVSVNPAPTDLNKLASGVVTELKVIAKQKEVKFKADLPKLPVVSTDQKMIREVMMNLLSNAIKYTPAKGRVALAAEVKRGDVIFSIADSGIGIPKAQQTKIFRKFFRAENAVVLETEGTGMGLYVAKKVVELLGGRIWFKSEENKGSTFFFTLPVAGSKLIEGERSLV